MDKIILASGSPRRKMLLEQIGVPFDIMVSASEETIDSMLSPGDVAMQLSEQKARDVANRLEEGYIVIGADTIVVFRDKILGKPQDKEDAYSMLSMLQGNAHEVYTGITLIRTRDGFIQNGFEKTEVSMRNMSSSLIKSYINTNEPLDKAGSYGIQGKGALLVDRICGDYNNVVGLPLRLLYELLEKSGFHVL